jgi:hypothetical protein
MLSEMGANVIIACRNAEKGQTAAEDIEKTTGNPTLDLLISPILPPLLPLLTGSRRSMTALIYLSTMQDLYQLPKGMQPTLPMDLRPSKRYEWFGEIF